MGHVFDLGRRVETDGFFALFLGASLLVWHYGYFSGWRRVATWTAGGLVASLAALVKGIQAPIAFFGTTYLFLAYRGELRSLLRPAHLAGLLAFLLPIAAWQVPFFARVGWEGTRMSWLDPASSRVRSDLASIFSQIVGFPFTVLIAILPWSLLLLAAGDRRFWGEHPRQRSVSVFLVLGMLSVFVPVWFADGLPRYVMGAYPLAAVACGLAIDRVLLADDGRWLAAWTTVLRLLLVSAVGGLCLLIVARISTPPLEVWWLRALVLPWWLLALFAILLAWLAPLVWRRSRSGSASDTVTCGAAIAVLLSIAFSGPVIGLRIARVEDLRPQIAALRELLPAEVRLVSFETLNIKFVYYWDEDIPVVRVEDADRALLETNGYFALNAPLGETMELPFAWDPLASLNMSIRKGDPEYQVIVARRRAEDR
jgi:hypothetical protein